MPVLLELVVLNWDLGFLVHHLQWEAAKEFPWILKKGMRAGAMKNETQENEEVVGRAAEITIGGKKRTEAEGGMEMRNILAQIAINKIEDDNITSTKVTINEEPYLKSYM